MGRVIFSGIIGAIIAFIWSFVSWVVLPWHDWTFRSFHNEEFVSWVIKENAKKDGVYIIPQMSNDTMDFTPKEWEKRFESGAGTRVKQEGPFVYAQIKRKGMNPSNPRYYIISFLTQFVGAALIGFLLSQATELKYGGRLLFVTLSGLVAGVLGQIPNWNWFGGGNLFLLVMLADLVITWFLAGLLMAAIIRPKPQSELPM